MRRVGARSVRVVGGAVCAPCFDSGALTAAAPGRSGTYLPPASAIVALRRYFRETPVLAAATPVAPPHLPAAGDAPTASVPAHCVVLDVLEAGPGLFKVAALHLDGATPGDSIVVNMDSQCVMPKAQLRSLRNMIQRKHCVTAVITTPRSSPLQLQGLRDVLGLNATDTAAFVFPAWLVARLMQADIAEARGDGSANDIAAYLTQPAGRDAAVFLDTVDFVARDRLRFHRETVAKGGSAAAASQRPTVTTTTTTTTTTKTLTSSASVASGAAASVSSAASTAATAEARAPQSAKRGKEAARAVASHQDAAPVKQPTRAVAAKDTSARATAAAEQKEELSGDMAQAVRAIERQSHSPAAKHQRALVAATNEVAARVAKSDRALKLATDAVQQVERDQRRLADEALAAAASEDIRSRAADLIVQGSHDVDGAKVDDVDLPTDPTDKLLAKAFGWAKRTPKVHVAATESIEATASLQQAESESTVEATDDTTSQATTVRNTRVAAKRAERKLSRASTTNAKPNGTALAAATQDTAPPVVLQPPPSPAPDTAGDASPVRPRTDATAVSVTADLERGSKILTKFGATADAEVMRCVHGAIARTQEERDDSDDELARIEDILSQPGVDDIDFAALADA